LSNETENESLEESIFKTLGNQKRRDILRIVGENKQATFTEIKKAAEIEDSSSVSYHLSSLKPLIAQKEDKYSLSELGQEAYNLIVKTSVYTSTSITLSYLRKQLTLLILANSIIWFAAIISTNLIAVQLSLNATFALIALWAISNGLLYTTSKRTNNEKECITKMIAKKVEYA